MKFEMLSVEGMTCSNCAAHVAKALSSLSGTSNVNVDLDKGIATLDIDPHAVTLEQLIAAIDEEGYTAKLFEGLSPK